METRPANRPVWPYILGAVLLLLLIVLVARSCRQEYGEVPPPFGDTVETDTAMGPMNEEGYGPVDTTMYDGSERDDGSDTGEAADTTVSPSTPTPPGAGTTSPPGGTPAVSPGAVP